MSKDRPAALEIPNQVEPPSLLQNFPLQIKRRRNTLAYLMLMPCVLPTYCNLFSLGALLQLLLSTIISFYQHSEYCMFLLNLLTVCLTCSVSSCSAVLFLGSRLISVLRLQSLKFKKIFFIENYPTKSCSTGFIDRCSPCCIKDCFHLITIMHQTLQNNEMKWRRTTCSSVNYSFSDKCLNLPHMLLCLHTHHSLCFLLSV